MAKKARQIKLLKNTNKDGDEKEKKKKKKKEIPTEDRGVFLRWDSSADQRYDEQTTEREGKGGGLLQSASRARLHRGRQLIMNYCMHLSVWWARRSPVPMEWC